MAATTISRVALAWPNFILPQYEGNNTAALTLRTPTFSGGTWTAGLPRTNWNSEYLYAVARSSAATNASTTSDVDLIVTRAISAVGVFRHNLTPSLGYSRWRARFSSLSTFPANLLASPDALATTWTAITATATNAFATYAGRSFSRIGNITAGVVYQGVTLPADGVNYVSCYIHRDTVEGIGKVNLYDFTATVIRASLTYTVAADGTITAVASVGTLVASQLVGEGVYWFLIAATGCVAANTNRVYASDSGGATITSVLMTRVSCEGERTGSGWDSGWMNCFQPNYNPSTFPVGIAPSAFTNAPTIADLQAYPSAGFAYVNATLELGRYLRIEFDDTTNTAGYIQIGKLFAGAAYQPDYNMAVGLQRGVRDGSLIETAEISGTRFAKRSRRRRTVSFTLPMLSEGQAMGWAYELAARLGTTEQLLYVQDPTALYGTHRTVMLATAEEPPAIENPYSVIGETNVKLIEVL